MNPINLAPRNETKIDIRFTDGPNMPAILTAIGATCTRAQSRYRWNADGTLTNLASNEPPITYTPGYGWGYKPDGGSQARWTNSNNPSLAAWTKTGYTLVGGTTETSPDPALLSYFIAETATNAVHEIARTQSVSLNGTLIYHAIFRPVGRRYFAVVFKTTNSAFSGATVVFDTQTATILSNTSNYPAAIFQRGSYFEVYVCGTATATATATISFVGCDDSGIPSTTTTYMGDTSKGFYWFNIQNLTGRFMPPVVVTTTSAITLVSDVLAVPKGTLNHDNFSVRADVTMLPYITGTVTIRIFTVTNAGATETKHLSVSLTSTTIVAGGSTGGVAYSAASSSLTLPGRCGVAGSFERGRSSVCSGNTVGRLAGALIGDAGLVYIGCGAAGASIFGNLIHSLSIYRSALRPAQLIRTARMTV